MQAIEGGTKIIIPPAESIRADYASIGSEYFSRASITYPASVTAQGAYIALLCKPANQLPSLIGEMLLCDEKRVGILHRAAINVHKHRGKGPQQIDAEKIRSIIRDDFTLAERMMILDDLELEDILKLYPDYRGKENDYRRKAHTTIIQKLAQDPSYF